MTAAAVAAAAAEAAAAAAAGAATAQYKTCFNSKVQNRASFGTCALNSAAQSIYSRYMIIWVRSHLLFNSLFPALLLYFKNPIGLQFIELTDLSLRQLFPYVSLPSPSLSLYNVPCLVRGLTKQNYLSFFLSFSLPCKPLSSPLLLL